MRSALMILALSLFTTLAACAGAPDERPCPSIMRYDQLEVRLEPPLRANGHWDLEVSVDGQTETCALDISGVGPATPAGGVVQSPSTRPDMTCTRLAVSGISNDGSIPAFRVEGTPSHVHVRVTQGGTLVGEGDYHPTYQPTEVDGPGCGTTQRASVSLSLRSGE